MEQDNTTFDRNGSSKRQERAVELFHQGYNCAQSVFAAYSDLYGVDEELALRLAASFGAGMGRMREVCGAVSGMFLVAGLHNGSAKPRDPEGKQKNYELVQQLAQIYRDSNGSIICRELLGLDKTTDVSDTKPQERNEQYYKKRPCVELIRQAAQMIEEQILTQE